MEINILGIKIKHKTMNEKFKILEQKMEDSIIQNKLFYFDIIFDLIQNIFYQKSLNKNFEPEKLLKNIKQPPYYLGQDSNQHYIDILLDIEPYKYKHKQYNNDKAIICWEIKRTQNNIEIIHNAIDYDKKIIYLGDGFLRSVTTYSDINVARKYRKGISFTLDDLTTYPDATKISRLEQMLNDENLIITDVQKLRARKCIDKIIETHLTKYNHQPIFQPDIGRKNVKKVLVVDQSYGDMSIAKGWASDETFKVMLDSAIKENPDADIIIKTHPDTMTGRKGGYYTGFKAYNNIYTMTEPINPISMIKYVDKVYVCSSQFGFEALMAGKEVHTFGMPFYAGWGLTNDAQKCERRTNKRTLEEMFYITYILYSYYVNPKTNKRCEIEEAMDYLLEMRDEYFRSLKSDKNMENKKKDYSLKSGERQYGTDIKEIRYDHIKRYELAIELIKNNISQNKNLKGMDIFCGNGYGSWLIANSIDAKLDSFDGSKEAIICAKQYYANPNIKYEHKLFPFNIKNNYYDFVVSMESIEHVQNDELFLKKIYNSLKSNGLLIISTPNMAKNDLKINPNHFHYRHYYNNEFEQKAENLGFTLCNKYGQDVYLVNSHGKHIGLLNSEAMKIKSDSEGQFTIFIFRK